MNENAKMNEAIAEIKMGKKHYWHLFQIHACHRIVSNQYYFTHINDLFLFSAIHLNKFCFSNILQYIWWLLN